MSHETTSPGRAMRPSTAADPAPHLLDGIALLRAADICATLKISRSHWLDLVARGEAPKPTIKSPRFTRWRASDVARWVQAQAGQEA